MKNDQINLVCLELDGFLSRIPSRSTMCPFQNRFLRQDCGSFGNPEAIFYFTLHTNNLFPQRWLRYLKTVTRLGFLTNNVQHVVHQFGTLRIVTLCPVVSGTALTLILLKINFISCFEKCGYRKRSYLGGKVDPTVRHEQNPSFRAQGPRARHGEHTFLLWNEWIN